jgi:hypothetical protein
MITTAALTQVRQVLAETIRRHLDDAEITATIYPDGAIEATPALPAIVIGNPRWAPSEGPTACYGLLSWPVAVLVARDGTSDPAANRLLEQIWPAVATALDQSRTGRVDTAQFGPYQVGGVTYPAYLITIKLTV